jgi:hypothetical protein
MTTPIRLRLSRAKGFDLQLLSRTTNGLPVVNVARPGKWGNPFNFSKPDWCWVALSYGCRGDALGRRTASVIAFREWINPPDGGRTVSMERGLVAEHGDERVEIGPRAKAGPAPSLDEVRTALRGHNLACWCPLPEPGQPDHCHAAVLLEVANG